MREVKEMANKSNSGHASAAKGQKKQTKTMSHGGTKGQTTTGKNNGKY